jgi:osmoprotectant transport system permease protein
MTAPSPSLTEPSVEPPDPSGEFTEVVRPSPKFPTRTAFIVVFVAVLAWYLFIADTAADNDFIGGIGTLLSGFARLPAVLSSFDGYASWWSWTTESEGMSNVFANMVDHLQLVAMSMLFATLISVVLGVIIHRIVALRGIVIGVAAVFLTIPSLALFAVFISVPGIGIGDRGPIIALTMYSILPILRNTITGLADVDRAVIESARGMGLNATQRLLKIELPLAWPIILTGIRVATLLNIGIAAIAPLVGGTGLGGYIRDGLQRFPDVTSVERVWTGVIFTVILALVADALIAVIRRLTTSRGLQT